MTTRNLLLLLTAVVIANEASAQITNESILQDIKSDIQSADANENLLVTKTGFNVFIQKKTLNYLTGVSDLSLAKFYASYTADNDKLNFGFNVPALNPYSRRLAFVINPMFEADVKNSFATLYKDDKWKNNIRGGLKVTYLIPFSTINFWGDESNKSRKDDFKILRTKKYQELEKKLTEETTAKTAEVTLIDGSKATPTTQPASNQKMKKKRNESFESIGLAEADYLEKERTFTWLQTAWISAWTLLPLTEAEKYISTDNTQAFKKTKFNLWELNLQLTYLIDNKKFGTFYISPWIKYFQNNSANADLMTTVDYGQYSQFPGTNPQNFALLETNKAYVGTYNEFMTTNFNFQIVYITPFQNTLIKPGLSFRFEKNWGDYSPTNLRFGLPLNIQGKDKPINIELQYRINDINNYKSIAEHKPTKTVGISLGFPISLLYK
jgi:hypothetical protein